MSLLNFSCCNNGDSYEFVEVVEKLLVAGDGIPDDPLTGSVPNLANFLNTS